MTLEMVFTAFLLDTQQEEVLWKKIVSLLVSFAKALDFSAGLLKYM